MGRDDCPPVVAAHPLFWRSEDFVEVTAQERTAPPGPAQRRRLTRPVPTRDAELPHHGGRDVRRVVRSGFRHRAPALERGRDHVESLVRVPPELAAEDGGPARAYAEPLWTGAARYMQVRAEAAPAAHTTRFAASLTTSSGVT
jgi:hypothetical protein